MEVALGGINYDTERKRFVIVLILVLMEVALGDDIFKNYYANTQES